MLFKDRTEAGSALAERLAPYAPERPIILAIPRGGVPVAFQVARALGAPLDIVVTRKLGAPHQRELAFGAVGPGGVRVLNSASVAQLGLQQDTVDAITERESAEVDRRLAKYRRGKRAPTLKDRTVIIVDDGIATGATCLAAVRYVRHESPRTLIVSTPVSAADSAQEIAAEVDDFVSLHTPVLFRAVGLWYEKFDQVSDEEVIGLLATSEAFAAGPEGRVGRTHGA